MSTLANHQTVLVRYGGARTEDYRDPDEVGYAERLVRLQCIIVDLLEKNERLRRIIATDSGVVTSMSPTTR
jgi:hypothetical protein